MISVSSMLALAHSGKASYHVMIDTDGSSDDIRAITILLASKEVEVIGIHCSAGELTEDESAERVRALLDSFYHQGIPISCGNDEINEVISNIMQEDEKVILVCLGSLNTLKLINQQISNLPEQLEMILWYNDNAELTVLNSKKQKEINALTSDQIKFYEIYGDDVLPYIPPTDFWVQMQDIPSRYASYLVNEHQACLVNSEDDSDCAILEEECAALFLLHADLFSLTDENNYKSAKLVYTDTIPDLYLRLLHEKEPNYKAFNSIPLQTNLFQTDIAVSAKGIVDTHGYDEWRSGLLTCELHGHIGIYSLIGMKMGIRAREYFNIGLDDMYIESLAGLKPPISCMNDGLQVSSGSSLGHGLISAVDTNNPIPSAIISFKQHQIRITLKPKYQSLIKQDIQEAIKEHGLGSKAYWAQVRLLAIKYWLEFDRHDIFEISRT